MSASESSRDFLLSRYGTKLYRIDHAAYEGESEQAIKYNQLQADETAYVANATSPLLQQHDVAVTFNARVGEISQPNNPYNPFAVASFNLILLSDQDFTPTSTHRAEIDSVGNWFITDEESPIAVRNRARRGIITEIRKGYLLQRPEDFLDSEFRSFVAKGIPQETPPLSQQRSHWALPVQGV